MKSLPRWVDLISSERSEDFICVADFILAQARISLKDAQPGSIPGWAFCGIRAISHYKSLELWGYRWICGGIVRLMGLSLDLWVIVRIVGNRWIYEEKCCKHYFVFSYCNLLYQTALFFDFFCNFGIQNHKIVVLFRRLIIGVMQHGVL